MGKVSDRLTAALELVGAQLKRDKKHRVYELPNGRTFVLPSTPSDVRAEANALSDLRAVSGVDVLAKPRKAPADVRAERRNRPGRAGELPWKASMSPLAEALRSTGIVEQQLRTELDAARAENAALLARIAELEMSWFARVTARFKRAA